MIVLDASAAVEWLLGRGGAGAVRRHLQDPGTTVHAPALLGVEVAAALRGLVLARKLGADRARAALEDLTDLGVEIYDPTDLLPRVWDLRDDVSAYDAAYLALAEVLDAPLVTADARLAGVPGVGAEVEVVASGG